jgi:excinuclease UvrABC ATPase subunit
MDSILIRGAREHNLKNVSLAIPRNALVVLTGVSGSGKSSLAFDTLFAEGQRRYVESPPEPDKQKKETIEAVVDRLAVRRDEDTRRRLR